MLIGKIDTAIASARLWVLLLKMRDPAPFYKIWGSLVLDQARANARAKGGRTLWEKIAESVHLKRVSQRGAELECTGLWGRIGLHKQTGGPIQVKNRSFLTIPIHQMAYGKTAGEVEMSGVRLFRPGKPGSKKRVLAYNDNGRLVSVFALCKKTRPQRADPWLPEKRWILRTGVEAAKRYIEQEK